MTEKLTVGAAQHKGRGVFASTKFAAGDFIESCPVITIPAKQRSVLDTTLLYDYYFSWGPELADAAICLGFGSLYNHSFKPNAQYVKDIEESKIDFVAIRDISVGEEITVNYNGEPNSLKSLWFEPVLEEP